MNRLFRRILVWGLTAAVAVNAVPAGSTAEAMPAIIDGTFNYTASDGPNVQEKNASFEIRYDCFMRSSFLGCCHLMDLSAAAALASSSYYGEKEDEYTRDPAYNSHNLVNLLRDAGFSGVETNKYYTIEKEEDSIGVALAYRTIRDEGKNYTLIAIVPRSAGYKREWAGDFNVGTGRMHAGFKAARDEILRFLKQYLTVHRISGDLKIWIAGHSRGGAVSNTVGGFLAGGGAVYLGQTIRIVPENIYCYTFATPRTIRPGLTHGEDLSVSGARADYPNDTPGETWTWKSDITVDPAAACYTGIRNYPLDYDAITHMPPEKGDWGYTRYGQVYSLDADGRLTSADMEMQLETFSTMVYRDYMDGGDPSAYGQYTVDLDKLLQKIGSGEPLDIKSLLEPTSGGPETASDWMMSRITGMVHTTTSPDVFVNGGYQKAMQSLMGLYGMLFNLSKLHIRDSSALIKPLAVLLLDYCVERMREDHIAKLGETDADVTVRLLVKILSEILKEDIPYEGFTMDILLGKAAQYLAPGKKETDLLKRIVAGLDDLSTIVGDALDLDLFDWFTNGTSMCRSEKAIRMIKAMAYGLEQDAYAVIYGGYLPGDPVSARQLFKDRVDVIYDVLYWISIADPDLIPKVDLDALKTIYDFDSLSDAGSCQKLVQVFFNDLLTDDTTGLPIQSLSKAADLYGVQAVDNVFASSLQMLRMLNFNEAYINAVAGYIQQMKDYFHPFRKVLMSILLYTEGETFSISGMLRTMATSYANSGIIPSAHYNECYLAWARAQRAAGILDHTFYAVVKGDGQVWEIGSETGAFFEVKRITEDRKTYDLFRSLRVDGRELPADAYTKKEGSLQITLTPAYLSGLALGLHRVDFLFSDGMASTNFTIRKTPVTGDASHPGGWLLMILIGLAGIASIGLTDSGIAGISKAGKMTRIVKRKKQRQAHF